MELPGSQSAPPDRAVDPPTVEDFSTISTDRPRSCAASAADMPVPDPTTRRSTVVSSIRRPFGMVALEVLTGVDVMPECSLFRPVLLISGTPLSMRYSEGFESEGIRPRYPAPNTIKDGPDMTVQAHDDEVRLMEGKAAPTRFARGWHCLGLVRDLGDATPHAVNAFGQRLVAFRGSDGRVNVLDGYCRHMGGDLSSGTVKGNEIACPFHDWRWGGDGRCKSVPYARRGPRLARTAAWTTLEQDGMLFVWKHPEGNPPPDEVTIPRIEGATSDEWTDWHW